MSNSLFDMELDEVTSIGFKDKEEFIKEAVNTYLAANKEKRIELAVSLYRKEKISLGRAVEIADIDYETFKKELAERGVKRKTTGFHGTEASLEYRK